MDPQAIEIKFPERIYGLVVIHTQSQSHLEDTTLKESVEADYLLKRSLLKSSHAISSTSIINKILGFTQVLNSTGDRNSEKLSSIKTIVKIDLK